MTRLRRLHAAIAVVAGIALTASIFGWQRLAVTLLVVIVIATVLSLEALRVLASRENRP